MGERGVRNAEVEGSNPLPSTTQYPYASSALEGRNVVPGEVVMAEELPTGLYMLAALVMVGALVCDFIWVATTALHAMH